MGLRFRLSAPPRLQNLSEDYVPSEAEGVSGQKPGRSAPQQEVMIWGRLDICGPVGLVSSPTQMGSVRFVPAKSNTAWVFRGFGV